MGRFFIGIFSNEISATFSVIIFIAFAFGVFAIFRREEGKFYSGFAGLAPNALTSLGILGTFTGIFIGLIDFDINSINRSVPTLLEGLKVAFGTSILGLFFALVLRLVILFATRSDVSDEEDVGKEILGQMEALVELAEDNNKTTSEGFANLHESITNGFDNQIQEFKSFADKMSEAFSRAIIDELSKAIHEFNKNLSEQFGENFKQLNIAVGKLLEWQDRYREHIETLEARFEVAARNLEAVQKATQSIADSTAAIPEHLEAHDNIMEALNKQLTDLYEGSASIIEMREKAEGAFPAISEQITDMVNTMQNSATQISESATESAKLITEAVQEQNDTQIAMLESLKNGFDDLVKKSLEQLNESIATLDKAMEERIVSAMQDMADRLGGINERFVEDYQPLLAEIRKIAELGKTATEGRS